MKNFLTITFLVFSINSISNLLCSEDPHLIRPYIEIKKSSMEKVVKPEAYDLTPIIKTEEFKLLLQNKELSFEKGTTQFNIKFVSDSNKQLLQYIPTNSSQELRVFPMVIQQQKNILYLKNSNEVLEKSLKFLVDTFIMRTNDRYEQKLNNKPDNKEKRANTVATETTKLLSENKEENSAEEHSDEDCCCCPIS